MASNNSLQKLLVNVPSASCDAFIKKYINSEWAGTADTVANTVVLPTVDARVSEGDGQNNQYDNKVVFLSKYHAIYTQGALFGYDKDFHNILTDLLTGISSTDSDKGVAVTTTLKYDGTDLVITNDVAVTTATYTNKVWGHPDNVVTGTTVKAYVDEQVAGAVAEATAAMNFCGSITEGSFEGIKAAASNGDVYVVEGNFTIGEGDAKETFEEGDLVIFRKDGEAAATYTVVERNLDGAVTAASNFTGNQILVAAGNNKTAYTTGYTTGGATFVTTGDSSYILATEAATAAYVVGKLGALDAGITYDANVNNYVSYTYTQTDGLVSDVTVGLKIAEYTYTAATESELSKFTYKNEADSYGLIDHVILNNYMNYVGDQLKELQDYVDSVDHSYITVNKSGDYVTVTSELTTADSNDYTYTVSVVTKTLGDAVGMYVGEDGKWHAADGTVTADGLATAADVAKEIVENEKVIAAALNDHEARLDALENDIDNLGDTITSSFEALDGTATASDANSYVSVTINEVDGKLTNEGSSLTVQYGEVDADLQVTTNGLIDAAQLAHVLNNINLWETFNPTPEA